MKNSIYYIICLISFISCTNEDNAVDTSITNLLELVDQVPHKTGTVIACASGSVIDQEIIVYLYPRPGVTTIRYFETDAIDVDPADLSNYNLLNLELTDFFNGYLKKFTRTTDRERWVIASFMENGILQLSNPIRLKHRSQNTQFVNTVNIDLTIPTAPDFSWKMHSTDRDAIYFQVVSDAQNNLLSGTYTFDTQFQYYELDNVVLNITRETPLDLVLGATYGFTVMGVSEDNWVNFLLQRSFVVE